MESDDATVAGVFLDVLNHIVGTEQAAVITSHEVPHDDAVVAPVAEEDVLEPSHPS